MPKRPVAALVPGSEHHPSTSGRTWTAHRQTRRALTSCRAGRHFIGRGSGPGRRATVRLADEYAACGAHFTLTAQCVRNVGDQDLAAKVSKIAADYVEAGEEHAADAGLARGVIQSQARALADEMSAHIGRDCANLGRLEVQRESCVRLRADPGARLRQLASQEIKRSAASVP